MQPTSHKVVWGAAVLARITRDPHCTELAVTIADHLLAIQTPPAPGSSTNQRTPPSTKPPKSQSGYKKSAPRSCIPYGACQRTVKMYQRRILGADPNIIIPTPFHRPYLYTGGAVRYVARPCGTTNFDKRSDPSSAAEAAPRQGERGPDQPSSPCFASLARLMDTPPRPGRATT
jgi:hypothetical protein